MSGKEEEEEETRMQMQMQLGEDAAPEVVGATVTTKGLGATVTETEEEMGSRISSSGSSSEEEEEVEEDDDDEIRSRSSAMLNNVTAISSPPYIERQRHHNHHRPGKRISSPETAGGEEEGEFGGNEGGYGDNNLINEQRILQFKEATTLELRDKIVAFSKSKDRSSSLDVTVTNDLHDSFVRQLCKRNGLTVSLAPEPTNVIHYAFGASRNEYYLPLQQHLFSSIWITNNSNNSGIARESRSPSITSEWDSHSVVPDLGKIKNEEIRRMLTISKPRDASDSPILRRTRILPYFAPLAIHTSNGGVPGETLPSYLPERLSPVGCAVLRDLIRRLSPDANDDFHIQREGALREIEREVRIWVAEVCKGKGMEGEDFGGLVCLSGSYMLGVADSVSDVDAVCVVPQQVTRNDFFTTLFARILKHPSVGMAFSLEEARIPLISLVFDGISIDLLFAQVAHLDRIPSTLDINDEPLLATMSMRCVMSLSGPRNALLIRQAVGKHYASFSVALRMIRFWAYQRGIYSGTLGMLGGISWAILVALIVQLIPGAEPGTIVLWFMRLYSSWNWKDIPVRLCASSVPSLGDDFFTAEDDFDEHHLEAPFDENEFQAMFSSSQFFKAVSTSSLSSTSFQGRGSQATRDQNGQIGGHGNFDTISVESGSVTSDAEPWIGRRAVVGFSPTTAMPSTMTAKPDESRKQKNAIRSRSSSSLEPIGVKPGFSTFRDSDASGEAKQGSTNSARANIAPRFSSIQEASLGTQLSASDRLRLQQHLSLQSFSSSGSVVPPANESRGRGRKQGTSFMSIIAPCFPPMNTSSRMTRSSFLAVQEEFKRGSDFLEFVRTRPHPSEVRDIMLKLFEPYNIFTEYEAFFRIHVLAMSDHGWARVHAFTLSRLRRFVTAMEDLAFVSRVRLLPCCFRIYDNAAPSLSAQFPAKFSRHGYFVIGFNRTQEARVALPEDLNEQVLDIERTVRFFQAISLDGGGLDKMRKKGRNASATTTQSGEETRDASGSVVSVEEEDDINVRIVVSLPFATKSNGAPTPAGETAPQLPQSPPQTPKISSYGMEAFVEITQMAREIHGNMTNELLTHIAHQYEKTAPASKAGRVPTYLVPAMHNHVPYAGSASPMVGSYPGATTTTVTSTTTGGMKTSSSVSSMTMANSIQRPSTAQSNASDSEMERSYKRAVAGNTSSSGFDPAFARGGRKKYGKPQGKNLHLSADPGYEGKGRRGGESGSMQRTTASLVSTGSSNVDAQDDDVPSRS